MRAYRGRLRADCARQEGHQYFDLPAHWRKARARFIKASYFDPERLVSLYDRTLPSSTNDEDTMAAVRPFCGTYLRWRQTRRRGAVSPRSGKEGGRVLDLGTRRRRWQAEERQQAGEAAEAGAAATVCGREDQRQPRLPSRRLPLLRD